MHRWFNSTAATLARPFRRQQTSNSLCCLVSNSYTMVLEHLAEDDAGILRQEPEEQEDRRQQEASFCAVPPDGAPRDNARCDGYSGHQEEHVDRHEEGPVRHQTAQNGQSRESWNGQSEHAKRFWWMHPDKSHCDADGHAVGKSVSVGSGRIAN